MSALLFFLVRSDADAAREMDPKEEELLAEAVENLSSRLALLEELGSRSPLPEDLKLEPHAMYSEQTLETLRSLYAPDDPGNAWVFQEEGSDDDGGSGMRAGAAQKYASASGDGISGGNASGTNASVVTVLDETGIRWGAKRLEDGTGSLYIRQFSGDYDAVCVKIPEEVGKLKITQISDGCFAGMKDVLVRVVLPDTIRRIGEEAFAGCRKLREINIPASLAETGEKAFAGTDLRYFYVPKENPVFESRDGVLYERAASRLAAYPAGNRREAYAIPEGTAEVAAGAFSGNPYLEECTVPASLKTLPAGVFSGTRIRFLDTAKDHSTYESKNGVLFGRTSNGSVGVLAFYPPGREQERYIVNRSTRSIEEEAFSANPYLKQVFLPEGLIRIGRAAFAGCRSLESISLPESLAYLDNYAFSGCTGLESVRLPSRLDVLEEGVFYGCISLDTLEMSDTTVVIGKRPDAGDQTDTLVDGVNRIAENLKEKYGRTIYQ